MEKIILISTLFLSTFSIYAELEAELPFADYTPTLQPKKEVPLGYEAVTGFRSSYIYRGEELSNQLLDFQLNGLFSYKPDKHLEYGIHYAGAVGDEDFSEASVNFQYFEEYGSWTYAVGANLRYLELNEGVFTAELNTAATYHFNRDHQLTGIVSYDTDEDGVYSNITYKGYTDINSKSFLSYELGVSAVYNYYDTEGFRDAFGRVTYTYNLSKQVSVTPFVGFSVTEDAERFYGGVWFETSF